MNKVKILTFEASCKAPDFKWSCENKMLESTLNTIVTPNSITLYTPNMGASLAQRAAELFKGKVLETDVVKFDPNVIY